MGEAVNVVRMTISVPRDLKADMDDVSTPVNWSAAAVGAFRVKLRELASVKETTTMDDVIARLKAADENDSNEQRQEGKEAGELWARDDARPRQLRRLLALDHLNGEGIDYHLGVYDNGMNHGIAWGLYAWLFNGDDFGNGDIDSFWEGAIGDGGREKIDDIDYASGFCEGALEVWEKVKGKL